MDARRTLGWTVQEFWKLPDDGLRYEILDGVLVREPAPAEVHQAIVRELLVVLLAHLGPSRRRGLYPAPIAVVLAPATVVQPDIVYVRPERTGIVRDSGIHGPPDLVIEILSPSTGERDLTIKRRLYATHGVVEYWIVAPEERVIHQCNAPEDGLYQRVAAFREKDVLASEVLDALHVPVAAVFAG